MCLVPGILLGTLTMEMGGKVTIDCPKTGYHCNLDFKLKVSHVNECLHLSGQEKIVMQAVTCSSTCTFLFYTKFVSSELKNLPSKPRVIFPTSHES